MRLYLMRHGNAMRGVSDALRRLSETGIREAEAAGVFLRDIGEKPSVIFHSVLSRSKETAERVMASMGLDGILTEREGLEPGDSPDDLLADIIAEFGKTEHKVMLVGHDPFISDLASLMIGRSKAALPIKFTTGTLLGADGVAGGSSWALRFYITSKHLERLAPRQVSKNVA